jgi:hypothetical protein
MKLDAVVTDGRDVESSTKSGWLAAQSMLSPFESNQFNAYPLEHVCTNRTRGFTVLNLLESVAHPVAGTSGPLVDVRAGEHVSVL